MISLDRHMAAQAEQLKVLKAQQRTFATIKRAFGDAEIGTLEDNSKGYVSDRLDGNSKGAKPIILINTFGYTGSGSHGNTNPNGRFTLRYMINIGEEIVYSKQSRNLSSAEVASLLNGLLKTQTGKDAASTLMLGAFLTRVGSEHAA